VTGLATRMGAALQAFPPELQGVRRRQLHFETQPVPAMRNWLPALLAQWRSPRKTLRVETTAGEIQGGISLPDLTILDRPQQPLKGTAFQAHATEASMQGRHRCYGGGLRVTTGLL